MLSWRKSRTLLVFAGCLIAACSGAPTSRYAIRNTTTKDHDIAKLAPLKHFCRQSEIEAYYGLPGVWEWKVSFRHPDRFGLILITEAGTQKYATTGKTVYGSVDGAILTEEPLSSSPLRSYLRWTTATTLAALTDVSTQLGLEMKADSAKHESSHARILEFKWIDDHATYVVHVDEDGRVTDASGPIEIPGVGSGNLTAEFRDHREVSRFQVPFKISYFLEGKKILEERILRYELETACP